MASTGTDDEDEDAGGDEEGGGGEDDNSHGGHGQGRGGWVDRRFASLTDASAYPSRVLKEGGEATIGTPVSAVVMPVPRGSTRMTGHKPDPRLCMCATGE